MLMERTSQTTGKRVQMEINCTEKEIQDYLNGDRPIQFALPNLSPAEREFILTGILPGEWEKIFPLEEDGELEDEIMYENHEKELFGPCHKLLDEM